MQQPQAEEDCAEEVDSEVALLADSVADSVADSEAASVDHALAYLLGGLGTIRSGPTILTIIPITAPTTLRPTHTPILIVIVLIRRRRHGKRQPLQGGGIIATTRRGITHTSGLAVAGKPCLPRRPDSTPVPTAKLGFIVPMRCLKTVIAVFLLTPSLLWASSDVTGTIKSLDWTNRHLILEDGTTYIVQRGINMGRYKSGEKVTLHTDDDHGQKIVSKITHGDHFPYVPKTRGNRRGL